jgi:hypothetical protein
MPETSITSVKTEHPLPLNIISKAEKAPRKGKRERSPTDEKTSQIATQKITDHSLSKSSLTLKKQKTQKIDLKHESLLSDDFPLLAKQHDNSNIPPLSQSSSNASTERQKPIPLEAGWQKVQVVNKHYHLSPCRAKLIDPKIGPHKIVYEGETNSDGLPHGKGTWYYDDGSSYAGEFVKGKRVGQGTIHYPADWGIETGFTGEWKNNKPYNGNGKYINGCDAIFVGEYKNGQHIEGTLFSTTYQTKINDWSTSLQTGTWKNNKFHEGTMITLINPEDRKTIPKNRIPAWNISEIEKQTTAPFKFTIKIGIWEQVNDPNNPLDNTVVFSGKATNETISRHNKNAQSPNAPLTLFSGEMKMDSRISGITHVIINNKIVAKFDGVWNEKEEFTGYTTNVILDLKNDYKSATYTGTIANNKRVSGCTRATHKNGTKSILTGDWSETNLFTGYAENYILNTTNSTYILFTGTLKNQKLNSGIIKVMQDGNILTEFDGTWSEDGVFTGNVVNETTYTDSNKTRWLFSGKKINGKFSEGRLERSDGTTTTVYIGKFSAENSCFTGTVTNLKTLSKKEGSYKLYTGSLINGKPSKGIMELIVDDEVMTTYEGEWNESNQFTGKVTKLKINGTKNTNLENILFSGHMENGIIMRGIYEFVDIKAIYEGQFQNMLPHGEGAYTDNLGHVWKGLFKNSRPFSGNGYYKNEHNVTFIGNFSDNFRNGTGVVVYPNGMKEEGTFVDCFLEGYGTRTTPDGSTSSGVYENGVLNGDSILSHTVDDKKIEIRGYRYKGLLNGIAEITIKTTSDQITDRYYQYYLYDNPTRISLDSLDTVNPPIYLKDIPTGKIIKQYSSIEHTFIECPGVINPDAIHLKPTEYPIPYMAPDETPVTEATFLNIAHELMKDSMSWEVIEIRIKLLFADIQNNMKKGEQLSTCDIINSYLTATSKLLLDPSINDPKKINAILEVAETKEKENNCLPGIAAKMNRTYNKLLGYHDFEQIILDALHQFKEEILIEHANTLLANKQLEEIAHVHYFSALMIAFADDFGLVASKGTVDNSAKKFIEFLERNRVRNNRLTLFYRKFYNIQTLVESVKMTIHQKVISQDPPNLLAEFADVIFTHLQQYKMFQKPTSELVYKDESHLLSKYFEESCNIYKFNTDALDDTQLSLVHKASVDEYILDNYFELTCVDEVKKPIGINKDGLAIVLKSMGIFLDLPPEIKKLFNMNNL